jgi:methylthioribose-1-phosphate isomerase
MVIRGAPAIGVAAAMGIALGMRRSNATGTKQFATEFQRTCDLMAATRPTAVNLFWALDRMRRTAADCPDLPPGSALERLLAEGGDEGSVHLSFEVGDGSVRTRVGPLRESAITAALQGPLPPPGHLTLRRILQTVVDSFGVEEAAGGHVVVRLEKLKGTP